MTALSPRAELAARFVEAALRGDPECSMTQTVAANALTMADALLASEPPAAQEQAEAEGVVWEIRRDEGRNGDDPGIFVHDQNGYVISHFFDFDPSREGVAALLAGRDRVRVRVTVCETEG